jgi:uncharacterized protein (DUF1015 family)
MDSCYTRSMPRISPFEGLVFDATVVGPLDRVTAPPYDVISEARRQGYLGASPFSIVHLDLAEGSDDPDHPESRYERAGQLLRDWESAGALVRSLTPCYYAYEMSFPRDGVPTAIRGLLVAMDLEPWGGNVLPHEETMPGPVQDRLRLLRATRTHLSPIYGTIPGPCPELADLLARAIAVPAPFGARDEQGVHHRMWPVPPSPGIAERLSAEPLLIADGHHRYTTALAYRDECRATDGPGPWDRVLTLVVDASTGSVPVLPFHRLQLTGDGPQAGTVVDDLRAALAALSDDDAVVATVTREHDELVFRMMELPGDPPAVQALHAAVLDDRLSPGSLRYLADAEAAVEAVREGSAVAAYLLPATTPERIHEAIETGVRLPQKSTYFWPKPRTGMVLMPLDPPPVG